MSNKLLRGFITIIATVTFAGLVWAADIDLNKDFPMAYPVDSGIPTLSQGLVSQVNSVANPGVVGTSNFDYATAYFGRSIAVGSDSVVHVVWCKSGDPSNEAWYSHSSDKGETWSTPIKVYDGYYGYKPAVAVDPNDPMKIFVAYVGYQNSGETRTCRMARSIDGGLTFEPSVLVAGSVLDTNNPDIIVDQSGGVHMAFDNYSDTFLRYNYSADGGVTWLDEPEICTIGYAGDDVFGASIQMDQNGNPHVMSGGGGGFGTWGTKGVIWNWRDMNIGIWMEIPPPEIAEPGVAGTPYPTMVFDSQNVGHAVYDAAGSVANRGVYYRTLSDGTWSDPVELPGSDGGTNLEPSIGIDENDVLYITYLDLIGDAGSGDLGATAGDVFTGTNVSGEWQFVNLTADGAGVCQLHPDVARNVLGGIMHVSFTQQCAEPFEVVHMVGYPWPPEPTIGLNQLPDTYNPSGPFKVAATTGDVEGYVASAVLKVWLNDTQVFEGEMTMLETDSYEAEITVDGAPGDVVKYQGIATDDEGYVGESSVMSFKILQPNQPMADILLVSDNVDDDVATYYLDVLDSLGYVYEHWDIQEHAGIDASVTTFGWKTIITWGWGVGSIPTRGYEGNPFAAFLDAGTADAPHNLYLGDMDYMWRNGEDAEPVFEPGNFAYDYFQIGEGANDPGADLDSLFLGDSGSPVSLSWADEPVEIMIDGPYGRGLNWTDWVYSVGDGYECFFAYNQGLTCGLHYDAGTFKTVYIAFPVDCVVDTTETGEYIPAAAGYQLATNILTWFGTEKGTPSGVDRNAAKVVDAYKLHQNYPNPFNPETKVAFDMPKNGRVKLTIYNSLGQEIRTLVDRKEVAGSHIEVWDGLDNSGVPVPSGVYFYTVKMGDYNKTLKMALMR